jgi:hypothetical protein
MAIEEEHTFYMIDDKMIIGILDLLNEYSHTRNN